MNLQIKSMFPKLVAGQNLIQLSNGTFYIGSSRSGHNFFENEQFRFLQYCNGSHDLLQISKIIGSDIKVLSHYLAIGVKNKYLQILNPLTETPLEKGAVGNFGNRLGSKADKNLTRREIEADFISAQGADGLQTLNARANKEILIFGSNKFAFALLAALYASGFNNSSVIGSFGKDGGQITADDISGGVIAPSDVGSTLNQLSKRISREHQLIHKPAQDLSAINQSSNKAPSLIIAMQPVPADYQQRWLSESTPHLVIGPIIDYQIDIGPLILPGQTPCLRCIDLAAISNAIAPEIATLKYLNQLDSLPAAVLSLVVGYTCLAAASYLDQVGPTSNLLTASALRVNLSQICKQSHIFWQGNSMCGCGADLGEYAGVKK
jgi:hypothetical protein